MFEQILAKLKTTYKDLGLGDTILKVTAEKLALTVKEEAEIETAVAGVSSEMKIYQSFADQQRTLQKEITDLKAAKPGEITKTPEELVAEAAAAGKVEPDKGGEEVPAWAKALIDSNKAISEGFQAIQSEKANQSNAEKLTSKLKDLGVNENFYNLQIHGKTFENDEAIEAFATSVKEAEDAYLQVTNNTRLAGSAGVPAGGKKEVGEQVSSDVQNFIKTNYKPNEAN